MVPGNALHHIAAEAVGVFGIVPVAGETSGGGVKPVHSGTIGANPQVALIVLQQGQNEVAAQARRIIGVVFEHHEAVPIIAVESVPGGEPHEALAILQDGKDPVLGQALVGGEVGEDEVFLGHPFLSLRRPWC